MKYFNTPILSDKLRLMHRTEVKDMWIEDSTEEHFRKWKTIEWWQTLSLEEDIQYFWETLQTRHIIVHNDNDNIRW